MELHIVEQRGAFTGSSGRHAEAKRRVGLVCLAAGGDEFRKIYLPCNVDMRLLGCGEYDDHCYLAGVTERHQKVGDAHGKNALTMSLQEGLNAAQFTLVFLSSVGLSPAMFP
jgi:hypothetical protein